VGVGLTDPEHRERALRLPHGTKSSGGPEGPEKCLEDALQLESGRCLRGAGLFHNRCPISQCDRFAGNRRHVLAWYNDSDQIQWVGGGEGGGFARGRADQRGFSGENRRPALLLRFSCRAKPACEPFLNERMGPR